MNITEQIEKYLNIRIHETEEDTTYVYRAPNVQIKDRKIDLKSGDMVIIDKTDLGKPGYSSDDKERRQYIKNGKPLIISKFYKTYYGDQMVVVTVGPGKTPFAYRSDKILKKV